MGLEESHFGSVPWTKKDVKNGILLDLALIISLIVLVILFRKLVTSHLLNYSIIFSHFPLLIILWFLVFKKYKGSLKFLGIKKFVPKMIGVGFALMIMGLIFSYLYLAILKLINIQIDSTMKVTTFRADLIPLIIFISGTIIVPIIEELFYRGFIFGGLMKHFGLVKSAIISSIIFSLVHLPVFSPHKLGVYFIMGYVLAFLYYESKSLIPSIIIHSFNNFMVLAVEYKKFISG